MFTNLQNPINLSRNFFRSAYCLRESRDGEEYIDIDTQDKLDPLIENQLEDFETDLDAVTIWFDQMIQNSLKEKQLDSQYFSNYSKAIYKTFISNCDISETEYNSIQENIRQGYIKTILLDITDLGRTNFTIDQETHEQHLNFFSFLDRAIETLGSEIFMKALVHEYLANKDLGNEDHNEFLQSLLSNGIRQSFLVLEPLFYDEFLKHPQQEQKVLVSLLNDLGLQFKPRPEYLLAAKAALSEPPSDLEISDSFGLDIFSFCSSIPADQDLIDLCYESLKNICDDDLTKKDAIDRNTLSSVLDFLAKIENFQLDSRFIDIFEKLLNETSNNKTGIKINGDDTLTNCILITLVKSNLKGVTVNPRFERLLINILINYDTESKSTNSKDSPILEAKAILALMVLAKLKLSNKALEALKDFKMEDENKLSKAIKKIVNSNFNKDTVTSAINKQLEIFKKLDSSEAEKRKALTKLALFFVEAKSLTFAIEQNLSSPIKAKDLNYFFIAQNYKMKNPDEFAKMKNEFINFLTKLSSSDDRKTSLIAEGLFPLFTDEVIKKAFVLISNYNSATFSALGTVILDSFTIENRQIFLKEFLEKNPEVKTNFKITEGFRDLKTKVMIDPEFRKLEPTLRNLEHTLQSLGFEFKQAI